MLYPYNISWEEKENFRNSRNLYLILKKNKKPTVSVIIPTFNEEDHLRECLNSIIKQDQNKLIKVLVVDDDSIDNTVKIANEYKKKINLRVLRKGTRDAEKGKKIVGTLASFGVNKRHKPITRCISYDLFQRDPIFIIFTPDIYETIIQKKKNYFLCKFKINNIPAQSLCLYRTKVLKKLFKDELYLMDNDVPVKLVKKGYDLFAFCPQVRVYHYLLKMSRRCLKKELGGC